MEPLACSIMTDGSRFEIWSHPNPDRIAVYLAECGHPYEDINKAAADWTEEDIRLAIKMLQRKLPTNDTKEG